MLLSLKPLSKQRGLESTAVTAGSGIPNSQEDSLLSLGRLPWLEYFYVQDPKEQSTRFDLFAKGFHNYLTFILALCTEKGIDFLLTGIETVPRHYSVRPQRFYELLLSRAQDPQNMHHGVLWSAQFDFLARISGESNGRQGLWPYVASEQRAVTELRVPVFYSDSKTGQIIDPEGFSFAVQTGDLYSSMRKRLTNLNQEEIKWQLQVLKVGWFTQIKYNQEAYRQEEKIIELPEDEKDRFFIDEKTTLFWREATIVAETLAHLAVLENGSANWLAINEPERKITALESNLYSGTAGIAIFLADYARIAKQDKFKDLSLAAIASVRAKIYSRDAVVFAHEIGIGGAVGLGSIIYAFTTISNFLNEPSLLEDAGVAAQLLTDSLIAEDTKLDIIAGSAGTILSLLRLYRETRQARVLERAILCGDHLLASYQLDANGRRYWAGVGVGVNLLTGMSHGAAGFGFAFACWPKQAGGKISAWPRRIV